MGIGGGIVLTLSLTIVWLTARIACSAFERDYRNFHQEILVHGYGAGTRRL